MYINPIDTIKNKISFSHLETKEFQNTNVKQDFIVNHQDVFEKQLNPKDLNSVYCGYTGKKTHDFPATKYMPKSAYPDVTCDLENFIKDSMEEIDSLLEKPLGFAKALHLFLKKFPTAEPWDTKFLPQFPGRDIEGKMQYAGFNNEIVSSSYVSNYFYGQLCAHLGLPLEFSQLAAMMDSCGIAEPFTKGKIPTLSHLKNKDSQYAQNAIKQGYEDYLKSKIDN